MAILMGFPPSNTISPSVRITEKDLSFIAPDQSFHRAGLVGFSSKGPINIPTLVATTRQLNTVFGFPHPDVSDPFLIYAAQQYLLVANELYVVRVADVDAVSDEAATTADVDIPSAGDLIQIVSQLAGDYTFDDGGGNTPAWFFRWRLNGVESEKALVVLAGTYTATELRDTLNDQLDFNQDGIEFIAQDDTYIGVKTVYAYGPDSEFEFVAIQNSIYGNTVINGNPTGLATSMTPASVTGTNDKYPEDNSLESTGSYDLSDFTDVDLNIQIVLDGTDNVLIDNVVQVISLNDLTGSDQVVADIVTEINSQRVSDSGTLPGGWICSSDAGSLVFTTLHTGRDARLRIKPASTAVNVFALPTTTAAGDGTKGVCCTDVDTLARITGAANDTNDITFTVTADSPGIEGNQTSVKITNDTRENNFVIEVYNNGVQVESWGNLVKDQTSRFYVETFITLVSDFIRVTDNTDIGAGPLNSVTAFPDTGVYALSGGSDGIPSDPDKQDALLIGNPIGFTGIYTLSEPEQIDLDLIAVPGHPSTAVTTALLDLCQNVRMDCLAIIDAPFGLTVNEIVAWQNGTHPLNLTRFDSDFGALYWPWVKIRDNFNRVDVWVPPSGSVMATIARSDFLSAPWFAPAGMNRGIVPGITDVYNRPTLEERDLMQGNRNCVNPIIQFVDVDGFLIWGQKTLQRNPTALDRVNVRRLMFACEKQIRVASRSLLFDPHDDIFTQKFIVLATNILRAIQVGRGIYDFIIKADAELNTPDVIDRNEFRARIGIQPVRAAEFIFIEFSVHRTRDFTANADTF